MSRLLARSSLTSWDGSVVRHHPARSRVPASSPPVQHHPGVGRTGRLAAAWRVEVWAPRGPSAGAGWPWGRAIAVTVCGLAGLRLPWSLAGNSQLCLGFLLSTRLVFSVAGSSASSPGCVRFEENPGTSPPFIPWSPGYERVFFSPPFAAFLCLF